MAASVHGVAEFLDFQGNYVDPRLKVADFGGRGLDFIVEDSEPVELSSSLSGVVGNVLLSAFDFPGSLSLFATYVSSGSRGVFFLRLLLFGRRGGLTARGLSPAGVRFYGAKSGAEKEGKSDNER